MDERLGIAGSGTIACGLAATAAEHGEVLMWVRSDASAERAAGRLDKACAKVDGAGRAHVRVVTDPHQLAEATFVVEAIAEDAGAKSRLLATLNGVLPPEAIVATTTSSLSVGELARASGRGERFLGFHVFNPVPAMELVEVVPGPETAPDTRERARALCEALGKTPVEVPDLPGFVVNRLLFPYLFGAVRLLEETGLEPEAVDTCMKLGAGHPLGPLALLDLVGLDVAAAIGEALALDVPAPVRALVADGALGRKAGRGFYAY
ncbi:MAG: 3-hydroxyacyl-CoA dehydrogenase family protein [Actinomycetota bacterium]|nr:3-hydroxyacyl-CoA dehydrogenase family protein [Actinomycetota bacterium]